MTTEDYLLYPSRYVIFRLCLDCLAQNLSKTKEMSDMSSTVVMLEKALKMLQSPNDASAVCNKRFIVGDEDVR
jgi:hypothetical protein